MYHVTEKRIRKNARMRKGKAIKRLLKTNRITSYYIEHNGVCLEGRVGWSNFCKRLSVHYPALMSPTNT